MTTADAEQLQPGDVIEATRFGRVKSRVVALVPDRAGTIIVLRNLSDAEPFCIEPDQLGSFRKVGKQ